MLLVGGGSDGFGVCDATPLQLYPPFTDFLISYARTMYRQPDTSVQLPRIESTQPSSARGWRFTLVPCDVIYVMGVSGFVTYFLRFQSMPVSSEL